VNSFTRLIPYVWPYRKKLLLSTFFAILVAVLWSLNLSAAFPVVKVLMEQQGLKEYVDQEIATAEVEIASRSATIGRIDDLIAEGDGDSVELLKDRARQQSKLSRATRLSLVMSWLKSNIMPWLPNDKFDMLALVMAVLLFATVLKSVFVFVQELLIGSVVQLTVMGIRKECFRKTLQLDYQTLSLNGTSDLMSRFTYDMSVLVQGLTLMGGKVVREPLKAFGCLAFAFFVNWRLTLLSMLFFPLGQEGLGRRSAPALAGGRSLFLLALAERIAGNGNQRSRKSVGRLAGQLAHGFGHIRHEILHLALHLLHLRAHVEDDFHAGQVDAQVACQRENYFQLLDVRVGVEARVAVGARRFEQAFAFVKTQRLRMDSELVGDHRDRIRSLGAFSARHVRPCPTVRPWDRRSSIRRTS
jgi:ABC-type multidrug transport system fused ATPase/permease subunit